MRITTSASCSRAPDSRRSESSGRWSERASGARDELRQHQDRHAQLLGQPLQRARDRRQFQRAVLEAAAAGHQLDVVDDEHVEAVLGLRAAAPWRASRARRSPAVSSMNSCASRSVPIACDELAVVALRRCGRSQAVASIRASDGEHAHEQLLLRHLEAEERRRVIAASLWCATCWRCSARGWSCPSTGAPRRSPGRRAGGRASSVEVGEAGGPTPVIGRCAARTASRSSGSSPGPVAASARSRPDAVLGDREDRASRPRRGSGPASWSAS